MTWIGSSLVQCTRAYPLKDFPNEWKTSKKKMVGNCSCFNCFAYYWTYWNLDELCSLNCLLRGSWHGCLLLGGAPCLTIMSIYSLNPFVTRSNKGCLSYQYQHVPLWGLDLIIEIGSVWLTITCYFRQWIRWCLWLCFVKRPFISWLKTIRSVILRSLQYLSTPRGPYRNCNNGQAGWYGCQVY